MSSLAQEEAFWERFGAKLTAMQERHQRALCQGGYDSGAPVLGDITSRALNTNINLAKAPLLPRASTPGRDAAMAIAQALSKPPRLLPDASRDAAALRIHQLALELVQAQHAASECQAGADNQKAQLSEAKAAQQAQLVASLDARLQAAHAALDASCAAVAEWRRGGAALLERYACILHGQEALPDGEALEQLQRQHTQLLRSVQQLPRCGDGNLPATLFASGTSSGAELQQEPERAHARAESLSRELESCKAMLQRRTDELRKLQSTHERLRGTHTALQAQSDLMQSAPWPSNCDAGVSPAPLPASDGCDVPSAAYVGAQAAEASSLGDLSAEAGGAGLKGLRAVLGQAHPSATAPADAGAMKLAYQAAVTKLQAAFRKQLQVADLRATTTSPSATRLDENCNIGINTAHRSQGAPHHLPQERNGTEGAASTRCVQELSEQVEELQRRLDQQQAASLDTTRTWSCRPAHAAGPGGGFARDLYAPHETPDLAERVRACLTRTGLPQQPLSRHDTRADEAPRPPVAHAEHRGRTLLRNSQHAHIGPDITQPVALATSPPRASLGAQASHASLRDALDLRSSLSPQSRAPQRKSAATAAHGTLGETLSGMASPACSDDGPFAAAPRRACAAMLPDTQPGLTPSCAAMPPPREPSISLGGLARACVGRDDAAQRGLGHQQGPIATREGERAAQDSRTPPGASAPLRGDASSRADLRSRGGDVAARPHSSWQAVGAPTHGDQHEARHAHAMGADTSGLPWVSKRNAPGDRLRAPALTAKCSQPTAQPIGPGTSFDAAWGQNSMRPTRKRSAESPRKWRASRSSSPDPPGSPWLDPGRGCFSTPRRTSPAHAHGRHRGALEI